MSAGRRVLLLGANGQLGCALRARFGKAELTVPERTEADFTRPENLRAIVQAARPELILNAAAYTAVDRAEADREAADLVNHQAVRVLGEEAERIGAVLIHYSTDYVFDGSKSDPWVETDRTAPLNVYGETKLAGEQALARVCSRYVVLRTSWVYGATGQNFLRTMLRLGGERELLRIVDDQHGAPTTVEALAAATHSLADSLLGEAGGATWAGVYHASCSGRVSWCGFASAILQAATAADGRVRAQVEPIGSAEYPTAAARPRNSVLSNAKLLHRFGLALPDWEEGLSSVMAQLA